MTESPLSEREQELLKLVATGASNKEVSQQLFISINTVKVHLRNIYTKLEVASRTEAAMWAVQNGLVDAGGGEGRTGSAGAEDIPEMTGIRLWFEQLNPFARFGLVAGIAIVFVVLGFGVSLLVRPDPQSLTPEEAALVSEIGETRWQVLAELPTARAGLATASYDDQLFAIGGEGVDGVVDVNERYDPITDSWVNLSPKPIPVSDVHAGVIGGRIYIPGGKLAAGHVTNQLEIYDPRLDTWMVGAPLPGGLSAYALATYEGKMYIFGGWDGSEYQDSVYLYDPGLDDWKALTPMPTVRGFASAVVADGKIFVIGGYDGEKALDVTETYNPIVDRDGEMPWDTQDPLPAGRYGMGAAYVTGQIYLIGGTGGEGDPAYLRYTLGEGAWIVDEGIDLEERANLGVEFMDNKLHILGGKSGSDISSDHYSNIVLFTVNLPVFIDNSP